MTGVNVLAVAHHLMCMFCLLFSGWVWTEKEDHWRAGERPGGREEKGTRGTQPAVTINAHIYSTNSH